MSKRTVKSYSLEFKQSSAKLAHETDQPISTTARELGVNECTLHGWVKRFHPTEAEKSNMPDDSAAELKRLRKENIRLKQERDILKKAAGVLCQRNTVKYAWIKQNKTNFNVGMMCDVLGVGRSSYYDWLKNTPSPRAIENQNIAKKIKQIFIEYRGNYGTRRIRKELIKKEISVSRRRVGKLMKQLGLMCKTKRKFKVTTDSNHQSPIAPNILKRDFSAVAPDLKYVGDITYIATQEGWLFLAVVIDLFSRRVVGWSMGKRMTVALVNDALLMALWNRKPKRGLLWHTDRGSQYASDSHRMILQAHGVTQSMSRKADCWDNAVAESFFHTLKTESTHHMRFKTRDEAKHCIFEYIEVFYNRKRMHSANDYLSPVEYEENIKIN
ncbi:MAG: IS3 family transposase [Legionellaceae bacterium]|nr:IS3 family transposase [Legionellaceae bacterium]